MKIFSFAGLADKGLKVNAERTLQYLVGWPLELELNVESIIQLLQFDAPGAFWDAHRLALTKGRQETERRHRLFHARPRSGRRLCSRGLLGRPHRGLARELEHPVLVRGAADPVECGNRHVGGGALGCAMRRYIPLLDRAAEGDKNEWGQLFADVQAMEQAVLVIPSK